MVLLRINRNTLDVRNKKYKSFFSIPNQMLLILLHISPTKTPRTFFFNIQIAIDPLHGLQEAHFFFWIYFGGFWTSWRKVCQLLNLGSLELLKLLVQGVTSADCSGSTVPIALSKDSSCSLHPSWPSKVWAVVGINRHLEIKSNRHCCYMDTAKGQVPREPQSMGY